MEICLKERHIKYTRPALNGVNKSNNLHTKWPPVNRVLRKINTNKCRNKIPVRIIDKATRNWQRYSRFDKISWRFSCPSTENP